MDREYDGKVGGELLDALFSAFEDMETQSAGILQFLKAKGLATDEELAPYLQQAADASNVRWLAARLRMDALLGAAIQQAEEEFARKMEEHARARDESTAQEQEGRGEARGKPANNESVDTQKGDAAQVDAAKKEAAEVKAEVKKEVESGFEVSAAKEVPTSENKRSEAAENNTHENAA